MSTYREVLRLQNLIITEGSVAKRRAASLDLQNLLTQDETLQRLAAEASNRTSQSKVSVRVSRWHALSLMWRGVMGSVVASVDATFSKRSVKLSRTDLSFFHRMVVACSTSSIGFETAYSKSKLGRTEVKAVLSLLLRMLDDEAALELDELLLLQTLSFVCGQAEYVTHFRPGRIQIVMEAIERRLTLDSLEGTGGADARGAVMTREAAALAFDNLCRTVTQQAITVDPILPGTIQLVSKLCQQASSKDGAALTSSSKRLVGESHLLSGVVALMRASPEQAVAPFARHGRAIVGYAKARYANQSTEAQRHAYHELFLAWTHLSVVAGQLQGLTAGDPGDMGRATLTYKQVSALLELIMAENLKPLTDYATGGGGIGSTDASFARRGGATADDGSAASISMSRPMEEGLRLDLRHRTRLDLTARLFAMAQRMYYTKVEWARLKQANSPPNRESDTGETQHNDNDGENGNEGDAQGNANADENDSGARSDATTMVDVSALLHLSERLSERYLELPTSRLRRSSPTNARSSPKVAGANDLEVVDQSPFYMHVLRPLLDSIRPEPAHEYRSPWLRLASASVAATQATSNPNAAARSQRSKTVQLLQVLCAAAEIFPVGVCWSTSCDEASWTTLRGTSDWGSASLDVLMGSADDLAAVVELVASSLVSSGGSAGDPAVQCWTLLCLRYLAQSTAVLSHFSRRDGLPSRVEMKVLQAPWRTVWSTLFRSDLRYLAHTKASSASSTLGYLVLTLLELMVQCSCTDPDCAWEPSIQARQSTFLYAHQEDVWRLPFFADPKALPIRGTAPGFELLYAVLFQVGLSDAGTDVIGTSYRADEESVNPEQASVDVKSRRGRLLDFCLRSAERVGVDDSSALRAISACLLSLTRGMGRDASTSSHTAAETNASWSLVSCSGITYFPLLIEHPHEEIRYLWSTPEPLTPKESGCPDLLDSIRSDVLTSIQRLLARELVNSQCTIAGADFVSASLSSTLVSSPLAFLTKRLRENPSADRDTGPEHTNDSHRELTFVALVAQLTALKLLLPLESSHQGSDELKEFPTHFTVAMRGACLLLASESVTDNERFVVLLHTYQISRSLLEGCAQGSCFIPATVGESLRSLFRFLQSVLDAYANDLDSTPTSERRASSQQSHNITFMDDEESDSASQKAPKQQKADRYRDTENLRTASRKRRIHEVSGEGFSNGEKITVQVPNQRVSVLVSLLLVTLQPTYHICHSVATLLLGVDGIFADERSEVTIDISGGIAAGRILVSEPFSSSRISQASGGRSRESPLFSLVSRVCIAACHVTLDPFLASWRLQCCTELVKHAELGSKEDTVTDDEAEVVFEHLGGDPGGEFAKYVEIRPFLRALQVRAATLVFETGRENLHRRMDKEFPRRFVLPSLVDIDGSVRRQAATAVAAAMRVLPEDKVMSSVLKRLPRIKTDLEGSSDEYEVWYTGLLYESSHQLWEDARVSVECSVLNCWCVMLGAVETELEASSQILHDIVQVAVLRADLENNCMQYLHCASLTLGYQTLEQCLVARVDDLLRFWIKKSEYSLHELPLLVSAPALHRRSLLIGIDRLSFDSVNARPVAASEFIADRIGDLAVILLSGVASRLIEESVTKEGRRLLFGDRFMRDLTSVFTDHFNDDVVKDVLAKAIPEVVAFKYGLSAGNDVEQRLARETEALLVATLTEEVVKSRARRRSSTLIRRFLDFSTRHRICEEQVLDCLIKLVSFLGGDEQDTSADIFACIHASTAEFLLYSRYLILKAVTHLDMTRSFTPMKLVFCLIAQQVGGASFNVGYALEAAASLLSTESHRTLHSPVADAVEGLLSRSLLFCDKSKQMRDQLKHGCKILLVACMGSHERSQKVFFDLCVKSTQASQRSRRRGAGLLQSSTAESLWEWDLTKRRAVDNVANLLSTLSDYRDHVPSEIVDSLVATFHLVRITLEGAERIGLEHNDIIGASPPYETPVENQRLLRRLNPSFCAQTLVEEKIDAHFSTQSDRSRVPSLLLPLIAGRLSSQTSPTDTLDVRVLRAELTVSTSFLRQRQTQGIDELNQDALQNLLRWLARICGSSIEVKVDASYLLGELWALLQGRRKDFFPSIMSSNDEDIDRGSGLEGYLHTKIIAALAVGIKNSRPAHALIAIETLKALMSYPEMALSVSLLQDVDGRRLLKTLGASTRAPSATYLRLTENEKILLRGHAGLISNSNFDDDEAWCWSETLWEAAADVSTSFDEWISCLVPGILVTSCARTGRRGMFDACQRLSAIDSNFAAAIFPAVLLQLLLQEPDASTVPTSPEGPVQNDTHGIHKSALYYRISNCFRALLETHIDRREPRGLRLCSDLELIVDTLSFFRRLASQRFTESTRPAIRTAKTQKSPESAKNGSAHLNEMTRSVSSGTILELNGLLVAEACILAGRPGSAVFFLEMYGDARFGRSTRAVSVLEAFNARDLRMDGTSTADISGTRLNQNQLGVELTPEECRRYLDTLQYSFEMLGDYDSSKSVLELRDEIMAFQNKNQPSTSRGGVASLSALQHLNNELNSSTFESPQMALETMAALEGLHLQSTARTYIAGVCAQGVATKRMTSIEKQKVRESWFRCSLNRLRWDDDVFRVDGMTPPGAAVGAQPGFYELMADSLYSLAADDYNLCLARIQSARMLLVDDVSAMSSPEANLLGFSESLESLSSLNDLEIVALNAGSAEETLEVCASHTKDDMDYARVSNGLSQTVAEICLRVVGSKLLREGNDHDAQAIRNELIAQLWGVCSSASANGTHATAIGALDRLRSLAQLENEGDAVTVSSMQLRLQEAAIIESQGDFSGAIRRSVHLVNHLEREAPSLERDMLLGDALLSSGSWMTKHKALPSRTILDKYMKPGVSCVVSAHQSKLDNKSARRATEGLLELAQLSSSLFETVSERIESREWQRAGRILLDRDSELQSCKKLVVSLQKSMSKLKKNSKEMADVFKKLHDSSIYCTQLERQVLNAQSERKKIESSIHEYRLLTVQSITTALCIADMRSSGEHSHFIYRMISLWFSSTVADESLNAAMRNAVENIPSYHFVPLANQLFSRLGQRVNGFTAPILQSLLYRMCLDHPYHCLVQLLCLSNGQMVGEGVGGRGKTFYLENTSSSKIDIARELIKTLKIANADTSDLLESYELITDAYIFLALNQVGDVPRGSQLQFTKIGRVASQRLDQCLSKHRPEAAPCVLTKPPPLRPRCDYKDSGGELIGTERVR